MKSDSGDPWYVHAGLYLIIAILTVILIKVAIIDPKEYMEAERYYKSESRLRMTNIKEAEILWQKKFGNFSGDLKGLIMFVKNDPYVDSVMNGYDSLTRKSTNPFKKLTSGEFTPDSLMFSPKTHSQYTLQVDTTTSVDTVVNRRGKITRIDSTVVLGARYFLKDPDGYGTVGDLYNDALKNTSSWQ